MWLWSSRDAVRQKNMPVFRLLAKNTVIPTVVNGQMVKKYSLKRKQVKGKSSNEKRIRTYKCSDLICSYHSTTFLQAFGKLNYWVKRNVMNMLNSGLNQRLNFGYFWIIMRSDTYVYYNTLFSHYTYSKYHDVLKW